MNERRLVKKVYQSSKDFYLKQRRKNKEEELEKETKNWCSNIHKLVTKYDLLDLWRDEQKINENTQEGWNKYIYKRVQQVEQKEWLRRINEKPKLRAYATFKTKLELESYLISESNKAARYLLTSIRTGSNKLRIETGRWKKPKEKIEERTCISCRSNQVEDEKHFILDCTHHQIIRNIMFETIKINTNNVVDLDTVSREEKWQTLMNPLNMKKEINEALKIFIKQAIRNRVI